MRNDPNYEWWEYACHEGNTIVPNYSTTSRHERANPEPSPELPAVMVDAKNQPTKEPVPADIAKALVGRWVGRPELKTMDYDIVIEFTATAGRRSRRETGRDHAARSARSADQQVALHHGSRRLGEGLHDQRPPADLHVPEHPAVEFRGRALGRRHRIEGVTNSAQGGLRITFRKR